jgi:hypothetical protein
MALIIGPAGPFFLLVNFNPRRTISCLSLLPKPSQPVFSLHLPFKGVNKLSWELTPLSTIPLFLTFYLSYGSGWNSIHPLTGLDGWIGIIYPAPNNGLSLESSSEK